MICFGKHGALALAPGPPGNLGRDLELWREVHLVTIFRDGKIRCPELDVFLSETVADVAVGAVPFKIVPKVLRILSMSPWRLREPME